MPLVAFDSLPADARVWVFAAATPLDASAERTLLAKVDEYLVQWKAHGAPLTVARDWRDGRFLTIGVDTSRELASGCSIDGLFRLLQGAESMLGTSMVGGGRVYYRDASGTVAGVDRDTFSSLAERGEVTRETIVFDLSVTALGVWRERFETPAGQSWHQTLFPALA